MKKKVAKKKPKPEYQTAYLCAVYTRSFRSNIDRAAKKLRQIRKKCPFDAIAFMGSSGAAFGYPLSYLLNIPVIYVRKENETCHSSYSVEGCSNAKRYLIIDDCISSGNTIKSIRYEVRKQFCGKSKAAGIFLYDSYRLAKFQTLPVFCLEWDDDASA